MQHATIAHEGALVHAAGDHRFSAHGNAGERCGLKLSARGNGRAQAHAPGVAIGLAADGQHVAAQVDHARGCPAAAQKLRNGVGDNAFRYAAKVDACLRIGNARPRPVHLNVSPIDVRKRFGNRMGIGHGFALEVPQTARAPHGDIEQAARTFAIPKRHAQGASKILAHLDPSARSRVEREKLAVGIETAQQQLIAFAQRLDFGQRAIINISSHRAHGVELPKCYGIELLHEASLFCRGPFTRPPGP